MKDTLPPFTGPDLCALEAHVVVDLLKVGEITPRDLLEASRTRVEAVEPAINAMPTTCWERAEARVEALEHGERSDPGWLSGLPIAIKDLMPVEGVRTTMGTRAMADYVPGESNPLVERLEVRGGLVVGKTNTPEFGAGANTFNDVFGPTFNPWDTRLSAAGSSGGAAAALAAGEVWLAHGSDHAGSLRTPAAFNGVVGLRPSPGRFGGAGPAVGFTIEGAQGPMARSVTDLALFMDAAAGFEPRFPISYPAPEVPFLEEVRRANEPPRIAWSPDLGGFGAVDAEVADHLAAAIDEIARAGAMVAEDTPDVTGLDATYRTLRGMGWATTVRSLPPGVRDHFKGTLEETTAFGEALNSAEIYDAQINRSRHHSEMVRFLTDFDVLALPVVGCMPKAQEIEWVQDVGGQRMETYIDWLRFAFLATTTGLPAISVPVGLGPRGLPVGLQLVGRPRDEATLLQAARFVERTFGGPLGPIDPQTYP